METYENIEIQEMPLSSPLLRSRVERFLGENGLSLEDVETYLAAVSPEGRIIAGAGIASNVIKCAAVDASARGTGVFGSIVSRLLSLAASRGIMDLRVYTKPSNVSIFESLGFHVIASCPSAAILENGDLLEVYCDYLRSFLRPSERCGVIVMNANPFTLGHKYLIDRALSRVDTLFVIPVAEDVSRFPLSERVAMMDLPPRALLVDGSEYQISSVTFPSYFLKSLSEASEAQMALDLKIFDEYIAPALGASIRFVGSEPSDPLTARYNELMHSTLRSVEVVEIPRTGVSATAVRDALRRGVFSEAAAMCPPTSWPYLAADLAERALRLELDTPLKPGLVCPESSGAHSDMDYGTMLSGIRAIRPFFPRFAMAPDVESLRALGIEAEEAMLRSTGGVNTHRGAIFAIGLALNAALHPAGSVLSATSDPAGLSGLSGRKLQFTDNQEDIERGVVEIAGPLLRNSLNNNNLHLTPKDARAMALCGYHDLFEDWLPFYRGLSRAEAEGTTSGAFARIETPQKPKHFGDPVMSRSDAEEGAPSASALQKTLLRIMSTLDDTCVVKRAGRDRADEVKREAAAALSALTAGPQRAEDDERSPEAALAELCRRYALEGISPGGAADMLSLTIFIDSITK